MARFLSSPPTPSFPPLFAHPRRALLLARLLDFTAWKMEKSVATKASGNCIADSFIWRVSCPGVAPNQIFSSRLISIPQISFWIDNQSIPARTALGITTVLAMTTLLFGVQSSLPSVPYIKAVDLFMIVSFANVFAALVEFAVVNYTSMREKERKESKPSKNKKNKYTVVRKSHSYTAIFSLSSVV